jgi:hypothetical protein
VTGRSAAFGVGTVAAVVSALPALPRVVGAGGSAALGLLALTGGTALVLGPALMLAGAVRAEKTGLRVALLGLSLAAAPLSLLGEALKRGTHHRPLGAATYAVLALAIVAGAVLVGWRLLRFSESGSPTAGRIVLGLTACGALGSVGFVLVRALGAPALVPHVLDGLRVLAAATLCHLLLRLPRVTNVAERAGAPLWVAAVVASLVVMTGLGGSVGWWGRGPTEQTGLRPHRTNRTGVTAAAVRAAAPVLGGPLAWF